MFGNLDTSTTVFLCLLGLAIWLWMLYEIIKSAVTSAIQKENERQSRHLIDHTRLLAELLKHNGVDEQRILEILDSSKPYSLGKKSE